MLFWEDFAVSDLPGSLRCSDYTLLRVSMTVCSWSVCSAPPRHGHDPFVTLPKQHKHTHRRSTCDVLASRRIFAASVRIRGARSVYIVYRCIYRYMQQIHHTHAHRYAHVRILRNGCATRKPHTCTHTHKMHRQRLVCEFLCVRVCLCNPLRNLLCHDRNLY